MIKYDVFRFYGNYRRISTTAGMRSLAEYYDPRAGAWRRSHIRAVELILGQHHELVARNVVFKDKVCSQ